VDGLVFEESLDVSRHIRSLDRDVAVFVVESLDRVRKSNQFLVGIRSAYASTTTHRFLEDRYFSHR
jgi:hypothetical protein